MASRTTLLLGASGLIGSLCLQELLRAEAYRNVVALVRSPLGMQHAKLASHVVDFERRETFAEFTRVDDVFSCIGTTRSQAASDQAYRRIDFDIPNDVAQLSFECGAAQFLIVSSVGANPRSRVFYTRLKGEIEQALGRMPFQSVHIFRPSFLMGARPQSRPTEIALAKAAPFFSWMLAGPLRKNKPIQAAVVARAMVRAALAGASGVQIYEFDRIQALGT